MIDPVAPYRALAANNAWANHVLLSACEALPDEDFAAERTGFFPSLRATLNHILSVDRYYLDVLEGGAEGYAVRDDVDYPSARALKAAQAEQDTRLTAYCGGLSADDLARDIATDRREDGVIQENVAALLLHLFQHQIHHRGQAHAMLSSTAVAPPQLDEFFIRYDRAPDAVTYGAPR
ncbi:damage-inducible protein DinB [Acuticoccus sediminis]|uniref:Damage-inducible protein DinB n=1 Tax=Acuticoccus sediminis TaxID=2184697 RepID=A0A8B2NRP4_9HYPH|nr:DinB family protein [Acuticoccus sediminis]RAH99773.1 damage-inducible protein DinB [Acuticoccus sediminis]